MNKIKQNLTRIALLSTLCCNVGCQSVQSLQGDPEIEAQIQQQTINVYHNVHYNNPEFYPAVKFEGGSYYSKRGYRY